MQRERLRLAKVKGEVKQQHCREELQLLRWSAPPLWANLTSNTIFYRTKATEASPHSGNFPVITLKHWFVHQYANKAPWNTTIFSKSMSLNFFLFCRILSWNFLFKSRIFSLPFEPLISRWRPSIDTMTTWCISPSYNETHDNITHANPVWSKAYSGFFCGFYTSGFQLCSPTSTDHFNIGPFQEGRASLWTISTHRAPQSWKSVVKHKLLALNFIV